MSLTQENVLTITLSTVNGVRTLTVDGCYDDPILALGMLAAAAQEIHRYQAALAGPPWPETYDLDVPEAV